MTRSKFIAVTFAITALVIEGNVLEQADRNIICPNNCQCQEEEIICPNLADVSLDSLPKASQTL